ncbi:hypothetical protein IVB30_20075 [Bradyrhizobium sp. 200]|uniref:hypothetical protein n=1 Tax=Bradyrhizobium sp. 200 TaxID=2782665 RepID=UPI0020004CB9|nr:hypothetical protein [Bradyrhizobium sp. 200]UPJ53406.1 hypothetical protein IVB30_20075 [Bradyrhizobium sp. 200]
MMARTWQQDLIARHPEFFIRTFRDRPFSPGWPTCDDGWAALVTKAVERIAAAAAGYPLHFTQIKSKYGTLRMYGMAEAPLPKAVDLAVEEAIALAEARSACTCENCGAEGRLHTRGCWLSTACAAHARGAPVPVRQGMEDLHIVRGFVGEDVRIIACRRYDRETDNFIDVDPRALGIGDEQ